MNNHRNNKELKGISRFFYILFYSLIISLIFSLVSRLGLPFFSNLFLRLPFYIIIITSLIVLIIFVYSIGTVPYTFRGSGLPGPSVTIQLTLSIIAILLFLWVIPALIIYWAVNPINLKKGIKIGIFIASTLLSVVYYLSNKKAFKSPADIVSFFSGTCLGPVAILEILF